MKVSKGGLEVAEQKKIIFNPNTKYSWEPNDTFELNGNQFGQILNAFRGILSTPEAQIIQISIEASKAMESILADAVEKGIAKEVTELQK